MYQCQFQILLVLLAFPRPTESDHFIRSRRSDDTTFTSLESLIHQQSTAIQSLQSQLTVTQNRLKEAEARIGSLESSDRDQSTQIAALKEEQAKSVAFSVHFVADPVSNIGLHSILKFNSVAFNAGAGYDPHTGLFTAPASGVYAFYLTMMSTGTDSAELRLVKEGTPVDYAHANSDRFDQGTLLATTHLNAGQKVWVEHHVGTTTIKGGHWTVFTGFLLHTD